jgi:ribose transport system permease protein
MPERALSALRRRPWLFAAGLAVILIIANVVAQTSFAKPGNYAAELATLAPILLVAFASTPAVVSGGGGLDLSMGPLAVMVNVLLVQSLLPHGLGSGWISAPLLLAIGGGVGAVNGFMVGYLRYVPVIATLCTTFVITGINTKVGAVPAPAGTNWTTQLAGSFGPVPGALILIVPPLLLWFALSRTSYHRALYAVGGNDVTAYAAGVNVRMTRVIAYAIGGVFAVLGGFALTGLLQTSVAGSTDDYILIGLTAVALGGTPLLGGRGGMTEAFWGAMVLYLIQSLLSSLNINPSWDDVSYGALLLGGVVLGAIVMMPRALRKATA